MAGTFTTDIVKTDTISEKTSGSGVTIDGVLIKDGTITTSAPIVNSVDAAITATGTTNADAYDLTEQFNVITGGAADTGVKLPTAAAGLEITVANLTSTDKKVYANASDQIDDKTATTGFVVLKAEQVATFRAYTAVLWQSDFEASNVYDLLYANAVLADSVERNSDLGTAGTNVTMREYGDGKDMTVVLSLSSVSLGAVAAGAAEVIGAKIYDYPAGAIVQHYSYMSVALTATTQTADTPDVGLGTDNADGDAIATLDLADGGSGDAENVLTGQTAADCNGTATVKTTVTPLVIEAADGHSLYLNVADTWSGADAGVTASGTVSIKYTLLG